ncbi:Stk1 family PASTA domain-containing Ser/Thr kinase [Helicovermis profundi]|uniref:non-specific serine/threonine protein kinase n=1 Tax=Helicovermis profundi TaxID=3065157 RepID=A0AAU9EDK1_9FIRM|nr:Stk1 family PASTA domain-containing Ser/Thr kinase [Clostridia bacterium S502]
MDKLIGKVLGNRYEVIEKIGEGGMALVYKARCQLLNRYVAVKVLRPEFAIEDDFVEKFEKESQAAASLSHPSIINIFDVGKDENIRYIVMELVDGITLKKYIKEKEGFVSNYDILNISKQISQALEHAHVNHIIHRDIKPHNIIISDDNRIKIGDFGIARAITSSTIVSSNEIVGSVHYTSPEQARGGFVDERSDIYSLGVLMYELATKKVPFDGDSPISVALKHLKEDVLIPSSYNSGINKGLESIILKALMKKPDDRYQSASELIEDLDKVIENPEVNVPLYISAEDSPTMVMPNLGEFMEKKEKKVKKQKKSNGKKSERKSVISVMITVLVALILTLVLFTVVFFKPITSMFMNKTITVPMVVNLEFNDGTKKLQDAGFNVEVSEYKYNDLVDKDNIISQSYPEGTKLKEGFTIDIEVSKGSVMVNVPNVVQKKYVEAQVVLENSKLTLGDVEYVDNDLPKGYVVSQSIAAGKQVKEKAIIDLKVSQGVKIETMIMPSLVGKTLEEAKEQLKPLAISINKITYNYSDDYNEGQIMIQGIKTGSEIKSGSSIELIVSKGKDPLSTAIDNTDTTATDGNDTPEQTTPSLVGYKDKTYIIPFNIETESKVVKVVMLQDNVETIVYEKKHFKTEDSLRIVIRGKGEAILKFYFDDQLVYTKDETF